MTHISSVVSIRLALSLRFSFTVQDRVFSFRSPYKTAHFRFVCTELWTTVADHGNVTTMTNVRRSPSVPAAAVYAVLALWRLSQTGRAAADNPVSDRCRIPNMVREGESRYFSPLSPKANETNAANNIVSNNMFRTDAYAGHTKTEHRVLRIFRVWRKTQNAPMFFFRLETVHGYRPSPSSLFSRLSWRGLPLP